MGTSLAKPVGPEVNQILIISQAVQKDEVSMGTDFTVMIGTKKGQA
jgi:hypothetical protein